MGEGKSGRTQRVTGDAIDAEKDKSSLASGLSVPDR